MNFKIASTPLEFVFCEIKSIVLKRKFLKQYKDSSNHKKIVDYVKKRIKLPLFPYNFVDQYKTSSIKIYRDSNLFYTFIDDKKMYLKDTFKTKYHAKRYIKNILLEQYSKSPHQYCDSNFKVNNGDIILDVGSAEGYFTLKNIEKIKHAYLFECDPKWIKALQKTFENYKDKITIICSKISDIDSDEFQTIDTICNDYKIEKVDFVKMDIEGYEEKALIGMKNVIKNNNIRMAICSYHTVGQEKRIREILSKNFKIVTNHQYMIYYYDYDISKQFLRHGVLRCNKKA